MSKRVRDESKAALSSQFAQVSCEMKSQQSEWSHNSAVVGSHSQARKQDRILEAQLMRNKRSCENHLFENEETSQNHDSQATALGAFQVIVV